MELVSDSTCFVYICCWAGQHSGTTHPRLFLSLTGKCLLLGLCKRTVSGIWKMAEIPTDHRPIMHCTWRITQSKWANHTNINTNNWTLCLTHHWQSYCCQLGLWSSQQKSSAKTYHEVSKWCHTRIIQFLSKYYYKYPLFCIMIIV